MQLRDRSSTPGDLRCCMSHVNVCWLIRGDADEGVVCRETNGPSACQSQTLPVAGGRLRRSYFGEVLALRVVNQFPQRRQTQLTLRGRVKSDRHPALVLSSSSVTVIMSSCSLVFGAFACFCIIVSALARPFNSDQESSDSLDKEVFVGVLDPHQLLQELFADRPLRFDKRGGPIWGHKRQNLPALKEIRKMRCYFNPVSC